jgi:hypothetical protein
MATHDGAAYFAGRVWGMTTHYDLGGSHPLVGHSVPNFELEDGPTIGELLRTGHGILLDFENNDALQALASDYGDRLEYVAGQAKDRLGLRAALIRPDGFVAWVAESDFNSNELRQAADRWFVSNTAGGATSLRRPAKESLRQDMAT